MTFEVQFAGFDRLMPFRVREILLVASPYDAFIIAEDDKLTELISSEYLGLNLRYAPRVTRVSTATEALGLLARGAQPLGRESDSRTQYDLIITMMRVGNMDIAAFCKAAKLEAPEVPVFLLAHHILDVQQLGPEDRKLIDRIFLWTGNARILLSIIKQLEDLRNIDHDIEAAEVQTILLVEDSMRFYSYFLPILYTELLKQTQRLMDEGVNLSHKLLRMRARPKILLACDYEEALELYEKYKSHLLGVIADIQFPRDGKLDPEAGLRLIERVKSDAADMPVLLQSSNKNYALRAEQLYSSFVHKGSPAWLEDLQRFILEHMGFGDFVFRLPDGNILLSAPDMHSLLKALRTVPDESVAYHASRNHFSKWLMARTEFELAYLIRPKKVSEFKAVAELREYLIRSVSRFLHTSEIGVVADFSTKFFREDSPFVRIGSGSLGGKGRGLAFLNSLLSRRKPDPKWGGVRIRTPNTAVLATDVFDSFLERNNLQAFLSSRPEDEEVRKAFIEAMMPRGILRDLEAFIDTIGYPLAVRSSSLLEDSQVKPFAGIYETYMVPNNHPDPAERLKQLCRAIQQVFASTYTSQARTYLGSTPHLQEEEKMAVIVQRLVGRRYGSRFYPDFSGVAQSYNYYPVGPIRQSDGIAYVTLGLGKSIVEGRRSLDFSPRHPNTLYQFSTVREALANSQREFLALDCARDDLLPGADSDANLLTLGLDAAEADGVLAALGSTYSAENDRIYDGLGRDGIRLVSFAGMLKSDGFPLADIIKYLLDAGEAAVGCPVEIEFAGTLEPKEFHLLQIRPMISWSLSLDVRLDEAARTQALCYSPRALGHGALAQVHDIVYVRPGPFEPRRMRSIADEIGRLNAEIAREGRSYVLIGPGRWGSADPNLGIPVNWSQISASRMIVETAPADFSVEPSYGTHFLHNVIAAGIGYLTVGHDSSAGKVDWDRLDALQAVTETPNLRRLRMDKPLDARIDGKKGEGAVLL